VSGLQNANRIFLLIVKSKMAEIEIYKNVKALIFDCDGTLVDSMPIHNYSWETAIKANGAEFNFDFFDSVKGMKSVDIVPLFNKTFGTNLITQKVIEAKHRVFYEKLPHLKAIDPVVKIAKDYYKKLLMAVVSGGSGKIVKAELETVGILELFDLILTADDDMKPKPAPDLFLYAAKHFNISAQDCQVFEDGELGIEAAIKAGMKITDVRDYI